MQEPTGSFESSEEFLDLLGRALEEPNTVSDQTKLEAPSISVAAATDVSSLKMDVHISTKPQWTKEFRCASPAARAIMLSQLLDAFNDGVEGIYVSFSEPEIK